MDPDVAAWVRGVERRIQAELSSDDSQPFRFLDSLTDGVGAVDAGVRSRVVVAVSAREDQSTRPAAEYMAGASVFADVVLPTPAEAPRLSTWALASSSTVGEPLVWSPGEELRLGRLIGDCVERCVEPRPSCRLFVTAEVDECPEELGWREFQGETTSDGRRQCEVRELEGQELERCQHDLQCSECASGFCRTKVPELVEECRWQSREPLPRLVGEAAGSGLRARFRYVCD